MKNWSTSTFGFFAGLAVVAYFLLLYAIDRRLMLNAWVNWGSLVIYLLFMVMALRQVKASADKRLTFREAVRPVFSVFVMASVTYYLMYYLLFAIIDPSLVDLQRELLMENTARFRSWMGQENSEEWRRQFENQDFSVTISNTLLSFAWSLIGGFGLSAVVAALENRRR